MANCVSPSKQKYENRFRGRTAASISRQLLGLVSYKPARGLNGRTEMPQPTVPAKRPLEDSDDPDYTSEDSPDPKPHARRKTRQSLPTNKSKPNMDIDRDLNASESDSTSEIEVDSDPDAGDITADGEITPVSNAEPRYTVIATLPNMLIY